MRRASKPQATQIQASIETKRLVVADLLAGFGARAVARLRELPEKTVRAIAFEVAGVVKPSVFNVRKSLN